MVAYTMLLVTCRPTYHVLCQTRQFILLTVLVLLLQIRMIMVFEKVFVRWLETMVTVENPEDILIVGMSCSGNSSNVIQALHWSDERGIPTFMISGRKSKILRDSVDELTFNYEYFHTVEISCMIIFYDVIHSLGHHCPSITKEIERLSDSPLRIRADILFKAYYEF